MSTGSRFVLPYQTVIDNTGVPLPGALLFFYASGTSDPLDTYANQGLTVPNTNPVVANAAGVFPSIFLGPLPYKVVLEDANGVEQWTADPVVGTADQAEALEITRAQIPTVVITAGTIMVSGYSIPGDLGCGAIYTDEGATSGSIGAIQDAAGTWFRLVIVGTVNVGWFGAVGDGIHDDTVALQTVLTDGLVGLLPNGTFKITDTLYVYKLNSGLVGVDSHGGNNFGTTGATTINYQGAAGKPIIQVAGNSPLGNSGFAGLNPGEWALQDVTLQNFSIVNNVAGQSNKGVAFYGATVPSAGGYGFVNTVRMSELYVRDTGDVCFYLRGGVFDVSGYNISGRTASATNGFEVSTSGDNPGEIYLYNPYFATGGWGIFGMYGMQVFGGYIQSLNGVNAFGYSSCWGLGLEAGGGYTAGTYGVQIEGNGTLELHLQGVSGYETVVQFGTPAGDVYTTNQVIVVVGVVNSYKYGVKVSNGAGRSGKITIGYLNGAQAGAVDFTDSFGFGTVEFTYNGRKYLNNDVYETKAISPSTQTLIAGGKIEPGPGPVLFLTSAGDVTLDVTNSIDVPQFAEATGYQSQVVTFLNIGAHNITLKNSAACVTASGSDIVMPSVATSVPLQFAWLFNAWRQV